MVQAPITVKVFVDVDTTACASFESIYSIIDYTVTFDTLYGGWKEFGKS